MPYRMLGAPARFGTAFDKTFPRGGNCYWQLATGKEIGAWLLDKPVRQWLAATLAERRAGQSRLRIELQVPPDLTNVPWEIACVQGLSHLAVDPRLSVFRIKPEAPKKKPQLHDRLKVLLCGVKLGGQDRPELETGSELSRIQQAIDQEYQDAEIDVVVDPLGDWQAVRELVFGRRAPHVFHFAGHGLKDGRGLVFRRKDGKPHHVGADQLATLFRQADDLKLAFFNACNSTGGKIGEHQPFGGIADMLIDSGTPMVVGMQTPILDNEAQSMATHFYSALLKGAWVDCALQKARSEMHLADKDGVGWAFLNLTVSTTPGALVELNRSRSEDVPPKVLKFGHADQRGELDLLLGATRPFVIVVHGKGKTGHRHVQKRLQYDLKNANRLIWQPVAQVNLLKEEEDDDTRRALIVGEIARTLGRPTDGKLDDLIESLGRFLGETSREDYVMVIDILNVLSIHTEGDEASVLDFVTSLWPKVVSVAAEYSDKLPIFMIFGIGDQDEDETGRDRCFVEKLGKLRRIDPKTNLRLRVLRELEQITPELIEDFLVTAASLNDVVAESKAIEFAGEGQDNEEILKRMGRYLRELS